jgi:hypothetical protein
LVYEITLRGRFTRSLSAAFDDLQPKATAGQDTVLRGDLADQAALQGVLTRVMRLGLEVVEVHECRD